MLLSAPERPKTERAAAFPLPESRYYVKLPLHHDLRRASLVAVTTVLSTATGPASAPFPHVERTRSIRLIQSSTAERGELEPMLDLALARCAACLIKFCRAVPPPLAKHSRGDLKPALALASVLSCAGVFRRCTKALPLAAVDARAPDLSGFGAFAGVCNDPTGNEQQS